MILNTAAADSRVTLDDLFRRAGVRRPQALALIDPPNAASISGSAPRALSYGEADRAISRLAAQLHSLGLRADAVVAIQLANTVDSVIALLAVLRAGMIAAPLPVLWRQQDMTAALSRCGAKAIITTARIGASAPAEAAMQAAVDVFAIRHICGFGNGLPDGVTPLDTAAAGDVFQASVRPGNAAAHVAVITFDVGGDGLVAVPRSHHELIAGGLAPFAQSGLAEDATILSTIPLGSFAGIALGLVPWLLAGGTLALHHGFAADVFTEQCRAHDVTGLVLPGPALTPLAAAGLLDAAKTIKTILALWRAPERLAAATAYPGKASLVDVASFGEIGLIPTRRSADGLAAPIRLGAITARGGDGNSSPIETARGKGGTLLLRGAMVAAQAYPADDAGFVDTSFACRLDGETIVLTAPPAGITAIGGYRLRQRDVDAAVAGADPDAVVIALPDLHLGQRLAGSSPDAVATVAVLQARGVHALVAGAFCPRAPLHAA